MSRWKTLSSKDIFTAGFFKLREDCCELPDGRVMPKYFVMDFADWVNVIALDTNGDVILVRQHRHGAEKDFLEIPGGSCDGRTEDPEIAGERELREETGFEPGEIISCGSHYPNPALQSNRLHTYVALNCRKVVEPELDEFEDLKVEIKPLKETLRLWSEGGFEHSLMAASIGRALTRLRDRGFDISF